MTICMSSSTLTNHRADTLRRWLGAGAIIVALAACSAQADGAAAVQPDEPVQVSTPDDEPQVTGVPAPAGEEGQPSDQSQIFSMEDMPDKFPERGGEPGCFITFAYRGSAPETLIWDGEPCSAVSTQFADRSFLEQSDNWAQLEDFEQADIGKLPDGRVLYVEGEFAAAIYPVGSTGTTYEVWVSD